MLKASSCLSRSWRDAADDGLFVIWGFLARGVQMYAQWKEV